MQRRIIFFTLAFLLFCCPVIGQQLNNEVKITDVFGNENPIIDCSYPLTGNCLTLKTTVPEFHQTTSYSVSAEEFTPYIAFNAGTALKVNADDSFTDKIKIPFNFCYFGNNYSEIVVGSNGVITFDSNQLGKINYPNIDSQNPNISLPKNMIFGVFSDLVFSTDNDSEIYYSVVGTAPFRKFVVNFYKGRILGCGDTSTSQIVLSEGTNTVEVFVENKPLICAQAKFANSLLGIINADGSLGYSPPQRNTGIWQAQNEAWKFTPSGALIIPTITWYNSKKDTIGSGDTVTVCPDKDENYSVELKYNICGNVDYILKASSSVTFAADYPVAKDFTKIFCGANSFTVDLNTDEYLKELTPKNPVDFKFSFYNTKAEAQTGNNPQPTNFVLSANRILYVRVENAADPNCYRISTLKLQLISESLLTNSISICDFNNDSVENDYQLSDFNSKLFSFPLNGTVHYFLSAADADNELNEVKTANLTDNFQLYVRYKIGSCSQTLGPITIRFNPSPIINSPLDFVFETCDYLGDKTEPFEFNDILGGLVTSDPNATLRFYATYQQAFSGTGSTLTTIREGLYQVFVRVEIPGGCFSIATINLNIKFTKIEAKDDTIYICYDGNEDIDVNLKDYTPTMLLQSPIGITTTFFLSMADAEIDNNPISNLQTITDNGNLVSKTFFVKFSDGSDCYAVKAIRINLVHVTIKQSNFEVCDFNNDGKENVALSSLSKSILGTQNGSVYYFKTREDAQLNQNPISTYTITNTGQLFVKIVSYNCSDIFPIDIVLTPTPVVEEVVTIVLDSVCDNNNDGLEPFDLTNYEAQIYAGATPVSFQYYRSYNPANNSLTGLIATPKGFIIPKTTVVYVKVSFAGGCFSVSTLNIKLNFLPVIVLKSAVLKKCDYDFNLNESFNLADALPQLFSNSENSLDLADLKVTYYLTESAANAGIPATQISSPVVTINSKKIVWARFTSRSIGCYSVAPIELRTYAPPKGKNSVIANLCDDNLDGLVDVNLTNFTDRMVYTPDAENVFTFYLTKSDAETDTNSIKNPEKFSFNQSLTRIWVRIQIIPGCFDTAFIDFSFGTKITFNNSGPFVINDCDVGNDGAETVDLTRFEKSIYTGGSFEYYPTVLDINNGTNKISEPKNYAFTENSGPQKIYAKVSAAGFCPEKVEIKLSLKKTPMFSLPDYYFCPDGFVDIKPDFSKLELISFEWKDPAGKVVSTTKELKAVKTAGIFTLKVTASNLCSFIAEFNVKIYEVPVITKLVPNGNSYTVIATGSKKILYSIDGINYQETNVFYNLPYGVITFYVKFDGSDCLGVIKKGLVLDIKNAFTPNDDGINDTWIIDDLNVFEGEKTNLKVFNRFKEKIYEQESATRLVWDGKIHGRIVSSDAYWYVLTMADGRVFNGWVLLKNRN